MIMTMPGCPHTYPGSVVIFTTLVDQLGVVHRDVGNNHTFNGGGTYKTSSNGYSVGQIYDNGLG